MNLLTYTRITWWMVTLFSVYDFLISQQLFEMPSAVPNNAIFDLFHGRWAKQTPSNELQLSTTLSTPNVQRTQTTICKDTLQNVLYGCGKVAACMRCATAAYTIHIPHPPSPLRVSRVSSLRAGLRACI